MTTFPLPLVDMLGTVGAFSIYAIIGFGFGYALESSGFGNSNKLAAQFYFKDMTVLKVMFTAIIVAMVGIFASTAIGLLDYSLLWVNPTYLWPGIVGGLIMGVGFIIGGFCPGTSLVALVTGKIDGMFFVAGVLFGIFLFGETVSLYDTFFNSSYLGRFTLMQWLDLPTGTVVLLVVIMALAMFLGGEYLEQVIGKKPMADAPRGRLVGAGGLIAAAVVVVLIGQPTHDDRLISKADEMDLKLSLSLVQVSPDELLDTLWDDKLKTILLDVRDEHDFNQFHLRDAIHVKSFELDTIANSLENVSANTVVVVMSNDEYAATDAWRNLVAENVSNVYLLEDGINGWLHRFGEGMPILAQDHGPDGLGWVFPMALGSGWEGAYPDPSHFDIQFTPKIKLELKRGPTAGGCG